MPIGSSEFLKGMLEEGEKYSGGGGGGIVSRILIEFGYHRYVNGHDFWSFWKPVAGREDMKRVSEEIRGRLQQAGCGDAPVFGLKVTIRKDVLGKDPYKDDLREFIPRWQEDAFGLLYNSIEENSLMVGEEFYGRVEYKANPFHVKKGEAGKTETDQNGVARFPSIRVPVERFASKEAAEAHVGGGESASDNVNGQWSELAKASYRDDINNLINLREEILNWYGEARKGVAFNNDATNFPLPVPATPPNLKKYIAEFYSIAAEDIDQLEELVPF